MRIVGGEFGGTPLSAPKGRTTRPTGERTREALFSILASQADFSLARARVLDLFAGVGAIGLEAVSRGATDVVMVEQDRRTAAMLRFNIEELGCGAQATVVQADAFGPAALAQSPRACDVVFLDPPYPLWREEATRTRLLELAARCRTVMKDKSFLILRTPEDLGEAFEGLPGFDGPETHRYAEDMFVHLFMPRAEGGAGDSEEG